jgi:two-component system, cell cycle sensor histidine kinase and response regulator CckA
MNHRSFNVLLADDDASVCLILSIILQRLGNDVEVVNNGKEAIALFAKKPDYFDILVTDHNMPLVSGLEVVNYVRKNDFGGKIMIISGFLNDELTKAYMAKRIDRIIQKPFTIESLVSTLRDILDQWKQTIPVSHG